MLSHFKISLALNVYFGLILAQLPHSYLVFIPMAGIVLDTYAYYTFLREEKELVEEAEEELDL